MCAVVSYNDSNLLWCGKYGGCSAPADAAFLYAIPLIVGIIVCVVAAVLLYKKVGNKADAHSPWHPYRVGFPKMWCICTKSLSTS
jgi:hypothetical protein